MASGLNLHGLNPDQSDAVKTLSGPLLVLAGAGTGKTRVVTFRIANLIRHGTSPDRILAVTLQTSRRRNEGTDRRVDRSPKRRSRKEKRPEPTVCTFHAHCVRILRRHAKSLGYPAKFSIYDRSDQESLARGVLRELRLPTSSLKPSDLLAIISNWKNASVHPVDAPHTLRRPTKNTSPRRDTDATRTRCKPVAPWTSMTSCCKPSPIRSAHRNSRPGGRPLRPRSRR